MGEQIVIKSIESTLNAAQSFCKFLSANDSGETGGHQAGIYISKPSIAILFDEPGIKGQNKEKWVKVKWQDDFYTDTRFIYYGQGTRNEYRITNFGRGFPFLKPEYTGALFVLNKYTETDYTGFVLNSEDEIQTFLDTFGLTPAETNKLIETKNAASEVREKQEIDNFINSLTDEFPASSEMSRAARMIHLKVYSDEISALINPDKMLLDWTDQEYRLFRAIEYSRYGDMVSRGFNSVEDFIVLANQVLNRRKSRAGKSLEHHLAAIFDENHIRYTAQGVTEGNKKPDFIFPSIEDYHNPIFSVQNLCTLAAKTTCKDRWRQVLNEADRLRDDNKYLCTMQRGISSAQLDEMQAEKVILVVPKPYISEYPKDRQDRIWTIRRFVDYIREKEGL